MPQVDLRWRPSGGRGEYEHVPSDVLMDRKIVIDVPSVPGARIVTDAWGRQRDGKPRLRRENPYDRGTLNVAPLIAALALLPNPVREDKGLLTLPLRDDGYVVSSITFHVEIDPSGDAVCTPLRMQVLHDPSTIDLFSRLRQIGALLVRKDLSDAAQDLSKRYLDRVRSGVPNSDLQEIARELAVWFQDVPDLSEPSSQIDESTPPPNSRAAEVILENLSVDETRRRLVSHYKLERDRKIRAAKVAHFYASHGRLYCENCEFSFEDGYGDYASGYIEVHHRTQLAALLPNTMTTFDDLMLLCANCHRVVHRKRSPLTPTELSEMTLFQFDGLNAKPKV